MEITVPGYAECANQKITCTHRPKVFQLTVPSSGTRYIRGSFKQSGWSSLRAHELNAIVECERGKPDHVWGHYSHIPKGYLEVFAELAEKHLVVIRDPIKTWATNWVDITQPLLKDRPDASKNKFALSHQAQIGPCWEYQNFFVKEYGAYVHRVDMDSLESLGFWAGINFVHDKAFRYSTPSAMKEAVEKKDLDRIKHLTQGTDYWKWFVEEATPTFADFYEEHGYDLWWT